jgi:hypothetical protein
MIKRVNVFAGFILILLISTSMVATASDTLRYKKEVPLSDTPNLVVLNLFISKDDVTPIASQAYYPGEWQLAEKSGANELQIDIADISSFEQYEKLWVETEIDGAVIGPREALLVIPPGISVGGLIESRDLGFKFPDATEQTTAGITPGDLSSHEGNASAHHSPVVTTTEILDGTIAPVDMNATQTFTIGGLTIDGTSSTFIKSTGDIRIHDNINGFRWYNTAGDTQFANFVIQSSSTTFTDVSNARTLIRSNADGIGIGTSSPGSTHAVTIPSLEVSGDLEIGLERVSASYTMSTQATCHSHGNLTCSYGSGTVQCPVGTRVLGGGSTGSAGRYGSLSQSYPASTTSWTCGSSYDLANSVRSCYAICARLE